MFKKLRRKLGVKGLAAELVDQTAAQALDKATGGKASQIERVVDEMKRDRGRG